MKPDVRLLPDCETLYRSAAAAFAKLATTAVREKGSFTVALSGGSTPKGMFTVLASDRSLGSEIPWDRIHFCWGDERCVPPDHADSNFKSANDALLNHVPLGPENIHRIRTEDGDATRVADDYERRLRSVFRLADGELPRFDLVFLGLGADGHTASLFPGTRAMSEWHRLVVSNWVGKLFAQRITMTPAVLNNAAQVIFLVQGEDKALALKGVLEGPFEPQQLPAQLVRPPRGKVLWLIEPSAARLLAGSSQEEAK